MTRTETSAPAKVDAPGVGAAAEVAATVEAILFASDRPLAPAKISDVGQLGGVRGVRDAVEALNARYAQAGNAFRVVEVAGGYQMQTTPEYAGVVARLTTSRTNARLSQAAMETLAIVAYRQPVLRADVEAIRGVACGEVLRGLMEKNLIRIVGRADEIGRPMLYGTTKHFLETFGLADLDGLPNVEQLRLPADADPAPAVEAQPIDDDNDDEDLDEGDDDDDLDQEEDDDHDGGDEDEFDEDDFDEDDEDDKFDDAGLKDDDFDDEEDRQ